MTDSNETYTQSLSNKSKLNLFLDADDTILNSSEVVIDIINKKYNTNKTIENLKDWGYKSIYKYITIEEVEEIYNSKEFFEKIKLKEGFIKFVNDFNKYIKITIITKGWEENLLHKKNFFKYNLPQAKFLGMCFAENNSFDKSNIDMSEGIQIDDRTDCLQSNANIKILYRDKPETFHNHVPIGQNNFYLCTSWEEIGQIIEFALNNRILLEKCE